MYRIYELDSLDKKDVDSTCEMQLYDLELCRNYGFSHPLVTFTVNLIGAKDESISEDECINVDEFADLIHKYFGKDNVLVLFENEKEL